MSLKEKLESIERECPFVPHTNAGRLYSTVRRMKMQEELDIPYEYRFSHAIFLKTRQRTHELDKKNWDEFYCGLSAELKRDYPELYERIFL